MAPARKTLPPNVADMANEAEAEDGSQPSASEGQESEDSSEDSAADSENNEKEELPAADETEDEDEGQPAVDTADPEYTNTALGVEKQFQLKDVGKWIKKRCEPVHVTKLSWDRERRRGQIRRLSPALVQRYFVNLIREDGKHLPRNMIRIIVVEKGGIRLLGVPFTRHLYLCSQTDATFQ